MPVNKVNSDVVEAIIVGFIFGGYLFCKGWRDLIPSSSATCPRREWSATSVLVSPGT
jgi:hypothetical protein